MHPASDSVSSLEESDVVARLGEPEGSGQTGHPGTDNDDAGHVPYCFAFRSPMIWVAASRPGPPITHPPG